MGEKTQIEWCDHTFNPWQGCMRVTKGCERCYAEKISHRFNSENPLWGPRAPRRVASKRAWRDPLRWNRLAKGAGERRRVFCASMGDVFERHADPEVNAVLDAARSRLWELIRSTPHLDWLLLTKRPENIEDMIPALWAEVQLPRNVWLGASVCGDRRDDLMVAHLARAGRFSHAAVTFLSYEPAIGPPDFLHAPGIDQVNWIIVGGESGPGARPFNTAWARAVVEYGKRWGVPVFVKQLGALPFDGELPLAHLRDRKGGDPTEWPADLRVREVP